jgi:hypothetical protein
MLELEGAQALLEAEEAVDDPLRMTRCLLAGKAVAGIVTAVDREHREVVTTNHRADGGKKAHGQAKAGRSAALAGARSRGVRPCVRQCPRGP